MIKSDISKLLYAIVASVIAWFLLWFIYDIMEIWRSLTTLAFANLAVMICLIVFVISGGIKQLKQALK